MTYKMQSGENFAIQTKGGGRIIVPNVVAEPQFNPTSAYAVNAKVWYGARQFICTTATTEPAQGQSNPTPEMDTAHWSVLPAEEMAKKSEVDALIPLLFAQYYPDGNVKGVAEFTPGIKYDAPDTVNRTITVKPFCNTGTAANDNSSLDGRVVIPPFVDAQGNGYISDDGTRYKVVGVSGGLYDSDNINLTVVVAPNTVTSIGAGAFDSCTSLTIISCIATTTIGMDAFSDCSSLASVDFGGTPRSSVPTLGKTAFYEVPPSCKIIVPYTQYDAWKAANGWKDLPQEFVRHAEKADKPATFTPGNIPRFDNDGNPVDSGVKPSDKLDSASAFPEFSTNSTYAVGKVVTHDGGLYICRTAVTTAGEWDAGDWTATTLDDLLSDMVPLVVVDDEITIVNVQSGTRLQGSDADFAARWPVCVPLAWCYGYVLSAGQAAQGIRLNNGYPGAPDGVGLVVESTTQVPYSAELVRTFMAPMTGSYDIELTIAAPDVSYNLPRYYDVLVDDATVPSLAYRGSTLNQGEVRITHPGSIALEKGEHRLRIRAVLDRYNVIMAVRGLRIAKVGGYFALNNALSGEAMPSVPTQNELAEAVKKLFTAFGGTIQ